MSIDLNLRPPEAIAPVKPPRRRLPRSRILAGALAIAAALGGGYFFTSGGDAPQAAPSTVEAVRGTVQESVTALGNLQPRDYVDVGAQVSGQLKTIHVKVGDQVKAGDVLAEIDPVVLIAKVEAGRAQLAGQRAQLLDREAQRDLANQTFERQSRLREGGTASQQVFEQAEAGARSAVAQVEALKAQIQQTESTLRGDEATLGYTKIVAPMAGTVVSLNGRQGQTLNTNQSAPIILRIADLNTMTVWTQVSEADISRLTLGMKAYFTTLGQPDRRWEGVLRQVLPTPEITNNVVLYTALFDVANPQHELLTQMTAQVFFPIAEAKDVVTVPATAVRRGPGGRTSVDVLAPGAASPKRRPVEIGVSTRVQVEVRSGLETGERVVVPDAGATRAPDAPRRPRLGGVGR